MFEYLIRKIAFKLATEAGREEPTEEDKKKAKKVLERIHYLKKYKEFNGS